MNMKLTPEARQVLTVLAQEEAKKFHSEEILPEHVVLAILKLKDGIAVKALQQLGFDVSEMQVEVGRSVPKSNGGLLYGSKPPSKRVQEMVASSFEEAGLIGQECVTNAHLLLGAINEKESVVARYLAKCKVALNDVRQLIQQFSATVS
jgi:ATP-dependent Clp protease ATP-binding subunit ClpC